MGFPSGSRISRSVTHGLLGVTGFGLRPKVGARPFRTTLISLEMAWRDAVHDLHLNTRQLVVRQRELLGGIRRCLEGTV